MQPRTKSLIINTITGALVIGIVIAGYIVFVKNKKTVAEIVAPSETIDKTIMMGIEINKTFKDIDELKAAVEGARAMIGSPVFQTLKDFSIVVPAEEFGRENPFIPANWKTNNK